MGEEGQLHAQPLYPRDISGTHCMEGWEGMDFNHVKFLYKPLMAYT